MRYRRANVQGGCYFFTVALANRKTALLVEHIDTLRHAFRLIRKRHPFEIVAMAVMPEHLHTVWQMPQGDADFALRWALIKSAFSRSIPKHEYIRPSHESKRERGIWQRRYWEHLIRDDEDLERHVNYIHYNPVKHGHATSPWDWPHSSLRQCAARGWYPDNWSIASDMNESEVGE